MKTARVVNRTRNAELARRAHVADTRWTRLRGLLGRPRLRPGDGLVIAPSRGVHTWGMRYAIDVVLLGEGGRVTALYPALEPWSRTRMHRDASRAVELPDGMIEATETRPDDRVEIVVSAIGSEDETRRELHVGGPEDTAPERRREAGRPGTRGDAA